METRRRLEDRLQAQSDALPAHCRQKGQPLTDTRWRPLQLHTVVGVVQVRVRHGYSAALGRWVCPAREAWGLSPYQRIAWHAIKSAVIYRLEQRAQSASGRGLLVEKYVVATPPQTSPLDFGAAVQAEARRRGLGREQTVYLVMDGAVWLWDLADDRLKSARKTLDPHEPSNEQTRIGWCSGPTEQAAR